MAAWLDPDPPRPAGPPVPQKGRSYKTKPKAPIFFLKKNKFGQKRAGRRLMYKLAMCKGLERKAQE